MNLYDWSQVNECQVVMSNDSTNLLSIPEAISDLSGSLYKPGVDSSHAESMQTRLSCLQHHRKVRISIIESTSTGEASLWLPMKVVTVVL